MPLSSREFDRLHQVLVSAFPDRTSLALLVRVSANENLEAIAGTDKLVGVVHELITWFEAHGLEKTLVSQAYIQNTGNPALKAFVQSFPHLVSREMLQEAGGLTEDLFPVGMHVTSAPSPGEIGEPGIITPAPPAAAPLEMDVPGGVISADSKGYIKRPTDGLALREILKQGATIVIKGPRQMGKSSLMLSVQNAAEQAKKQVALVDLQMFNKAALSDADAFYRQFSFMVADAAGLDDETESYWKLPGLNLKCTRYFEKYILKELEKRQETIVLALDEAERILDTDFGSDFYAMLRSWHGFRFSKPVWKRFDMVLVTSTEPYQLINRDHQSPFNVGLILDLEDFDPQQVAELIDRYQATALKDHSARLWNLLEGHPYLTQQALYVLSEEYTIERLFAEATWDTGPFGDHLRHHLFRLRGQEKLTAGFLQVIEHNRCQDMETLYRLRSAGLIRETNDNRVKPRCKLYADYFRNYLHG